MTQVGTTKKWYLPFRLMTSKFSYTNPTGYKYIEGSITTDDRKLYKFKINLPWKRFGLYIDDTEGNKICSFLNNKSSQHLGIVSEAKQIATTASNTYIVKKPVLTATQSKGNELATTKASLEKQMNDLAVALNNAKTAIALEEQAYNTVKALATESQAKQNSFSSQLSTLNAQIGEINSTLELLKVSASVSVDQAATLKTKVDNANAACKGYITTLQSFAPNRATETKAIDDAVAKLNQVDVSTNLNRIFPSS